MVTDKGMTILVDAIEGVISQIELIAHASFSLSLQDVIDHLGNTDYVLLYYYEPFTPRMEVNTSYITLYYPEAGYIVSASIPSTLYSGAGVKACISGTELINNVLIVKTDSINQVLADLNRLPYFARQDSEDDWNEWRNYILDGLKPLPDFGCFYMPFPPEALLGMRTW